MQRSASLPSATEIAAYLAYEPGTGRLTRLKGSGRFAAGAEAGSVDDLGYRYVGICYRRFAAHRVAWLLATGNWPDGEIDHINGDPGDNRLANLRVVDRVTNMQNRHAAQINNRSSGLLGVTWNKRARKWQSQIKVGAKMRYLGVFEEKAAAAAAYLAAKRSAHAGCTI